MPLFEEDVLEALDTRLATLEGIVTDFHEGSTGQSHIYAWDDQSPRQFIGLGYTLAEGNYITLARVANTPHVTISVEGGLMNVDYVVDPDGRGTHTTLTSAMADAIASGNNVTIWICSSPTAEDVIDVGGIGSSQIITIASHSQYSVVLTAKANQDIIKQDSIGGNTAGGLRFRNLGFSIPTADYAIYYVNTISEMTSLSFEECDFSGKYLARQAGNTNLLTAVTLRAADCTGSLDGYFKQTHTSQAAPDVLAAYNNDLTLTAWWDGGSGDSCPDFVEIDGGRYTVNSALNIGDGMDRVMFQNLWITTGVAAALFTTAADSQNIDDLSFKNLTIRFTHADGRFGNFGCRSDTGQNDTLTVIGVTGYRAAGGSSTETFLTIDTDWKNPYVSSLWAPDWATLYTGPLMDEDALHYHSILRDADNDTKIQVEESADEDIVRVDTGGTERVTIDGTDMLVKTVPIQTVAISEPNTPSAGAIRLFSYISGGQVILASKGPDGVVCNICTFTNVAVPHTNTLALNWIE